MSLVIGDYTLSGLRAAAEIETLSDLITQAFQTALTGAEATTKPSVAAKSAFAGLLTLIFEAARSDASAADITHVLEDASWPSAGVAQMSTLFTAHKDALRLGSASATASSSSSAPAVAGAAVPSLSSLSSTSFPSVVGVSWRLDDYLRSDAIEGVRLPSYMISLQTQQQQQSNGGPIEGATEQTPFACNFQQLQDLLAKLKDAQKQIQQRVE